MRTYLLLSLFIVAQILGLAILQFYIDFPESARSGQTQLHNERYFVQPLTTQNETYTFIPLIIAILIGTVLVLLVMKYARYLWKIWFVLSVWITLTYAFWPALHALPILVAILLALILAVWKIYFPNVWVHNATELFIYGGLSAIFVPLLNIYSAVILLILIAIYDYIAVYKIKHMVTLAKTQIDQKVIAGIWLGGKPSGKKEKKQATLIGGGDIAFPLLFAGALMKYFGTLTSGLIIIACASAGLALLFALAKEDKFYPAMPFISAGCLVGMGVAFL